uniref:Melanoma-associated antigen 8-like n=1 Tax=Tursiops truncatus TaxID=9739 RepID=A0A6J3QWN7_TURTR|nr:melanoma-associated antigen 8-like [Tursiops truncatus]
MSELRQPEADLEAPVPAQGPVEAPLLGAAGEEAASPLVLRLPWRPPFSAYAEPLSREALVALMADLVGFLLVKFRTGEPTSEAEMLSTVVREHRDHFPVVYSHACECLLLAFGLDVKEVDPRERTYVLVPTLGLTWDAVLSDWQRTPEASLPLLVLTMVTLFGDRVPEEEVWGKLGTLGFVAEGAAHRSVGADGLPEVPAGAPQRPCPLRVPVGSRAYAEASECQVLQHLLRINSMAPRFFPSVSAGV